MTQTSPQPAEWEPEIIRRCQKGQSEPFGRLVDRYKNWIYRQIYHWVGSEEVAQEMAQEVFIKAYSQMGSFRGEAKFSTWLFTIAFNRCRDYWKSRERRRDQTPSLEDSPELPALSPEAEERSIQAQRQKELHRALATLPEIYREALTLRFLNEMSYPEIARLQGQGLSSVKMRVARGLDLLRTKLKEA